MLFQVAFKVFLMYLSGLEKGIKALAGSRLSSACAREYTDSVRVRLYILKLRNPIKNRVLDESILSWCLLFELLCNLAELTKCRRDIAVESSSI